MWGLEDYSWPTGAESPLVQFVDDDSYTHAIIINAARPQLKPDVTKDKVIGLAFEPLELLSPGDPRFRQFVQQNIIPQLIDSQFYQYGKQHISEVFVGKASPLPDDLFVPGYNFMYSDNWQENRKRQKNKSKTMSLILSKKQFLPGHMYRKQLAELLLQTELDVDIYGYGAEFDDPRNKGAFEDTEPYDDYLYTIAIENTPSDCYITEKILNPIGCDCIPLYFGAKKVEEYLGHNCCYRLTGNVVEDFNTIIKIVTDPQKYLLSLETAQQEIEDGKACFPRFLAERWKGDDLEATD